MGKHRNHESRLRAKLDGWRTYALTSTGYEAYKNRYGQHPTRGRDQIRQHLWSRNPHPQQLPEQYKQLVTQMSPDDVIVAQERHLEG